MRECSFLVQFPFGFIKVGGSSFLFTDLCLVG